MSHGIPKPRGKSRKSKNYNQMLGYQNKPSAPKAVPVTTPSQASINATLLREQQAQLALQQQQLAQAQAELEARPTAATSVCCSATSSTAATTTIHAKWRRRR